MKINRNKSGKSSPVQKVDGLVFGLVQSRVYLSVVADHQKYCQTLFHKNKKKLSLFQLNTQSISPDISWFYNPVVKDLGATEYIIDVNKLIIETFTVMMTIMMMVMVAMVMITTMMMVMMTIIMMVMIETCTEEEPCTRPGEWFLQTSRRAATKPF